MSASASTLVDRLREFWRSLAPDSGDVEPWVNLVDEWRPEFNWRGPPLTFDRRRKVVLRGGRVLARFADIESVDVTHVIDDDRPECWKVGFSTGMFSSVEIGRTRDDVEASIAAARVATVAGVQVRSLRIHLR